MSGQLLSNAVSDVMSFSPRLSGNSLLLFLLAAVKQKIRIRSYLGCVWQPRKRVGIFSADPLGQTQRFNRRLVYRRRHDQAMVALKIRNRCSCRRIERSSNWAKVIPALL